MTVKGRQTLLVATCTADPCKGHTSFPRRQLHVAAAYADTEAAIRAVDTAKFDYYSMKPWDPPEENLYPVLHDLLGD
jgi:thioredoxin reductase (NADPH)